ncbi:CREB/ATF bZIP transcription factor-like isoform X2 [Diabrotica undecimpunctata]|uniref:CREB/ATF bZIP transcription factor-like isoform X2 n=1 Tax=Diabrotica undecimpunctata TaxID=50387 RepID=UPI003B63AF7C
MVSTGKRLPYVSIKMSSSDDESSEELDYQNENIVCGETDAISRRKPRCLSKNAQMARENRLRKKLYLNKLEREVLSLRNDNKKLNSILKNQSLIIKDLKQEKKYLNSVIANSGDIKNLIRNIHTSTDDLFQINSPTSSLEDHNYTTQDVHENDDAGVCLHVSKHRVSLEFCSKCSETAGKSWSQL